jgi:hypothetical protein
VHNGVAMGCLDSRPSFDVPDSATRDRKTRPSVTPAFRLQRLVSCGYRLLGPGAVALLGATAITIQVAHAEPRPLPFDTPPPDPTPYVVPERLVIPELPDSPSPAELGEVAYYFHCMPCHGDFGQGLTEEWREVWVEDHQNCWARGCHAGRPGDEGFPIPRFVPGLIGEPGALSRFPSIQSLEAYLRRTHPPQQPGTLSNEVYQGLTAFLLEANGRGAEVDGMGGQDKMAGLTGAVLGGVLLGAWAIARRERGLIGREHLPVPAEDPGGDSSAPMV